MTRNDHFKDWERDFRDFLDAPSIRPPSQISSEVLARVSSELNPSPWMVFLKLVGIVAIAGSASLLVCPQLGIGSDYMPLMGLFMKLGPLWCKSACGAFFMVISIACACIILRAEELRVLRRTSFLSIGGVASLGLGAFICASPDVLLSAAITWLIGAAIGGIITIETGYFVKRSIIRYRYVSI